MLTILKVFVGAIMCVLIAVNGFARLYGNGSGNGFEDPDQSAESVTGVNSIELLVEQGAGYYLKAYADYLQFSNEFEMQDQEGIDHELWKTKISNSLQNLQAAKSTYYQLVQLADATPYDWRVIYNLWFFNYHEFQRVNRLNSVIFQEVEYYLSAGDIVGVYWKMYCDMVVIEKKLKEVKLDVDAGRIPELSGMWDLNESFSKTLTFGQYVTRIFYAI